MKLFSTLMFLFIGILFVVQPVAAGDSVEPATGDTTGQEAATPAPVPEEPLRQLEMAVEAVFRSWNSARAREYRQMSGQRLVAVRRGPGAVSPPRLDVPRGAAPPAGRAPRDARVAGRGGGAVDGGGAVRAADHRRGRDRQRRRGADRKRFGWLAAQVTGGSTNPGPECTAGAARATAERLLAAAARVVPDGPAEIGPVHAVIRCPDRTRAPAKADPTR